MNKNNQIGSSEAMATSSMQSVMALIHYLQSNSMSAEEIAAAAGCSVGMFSDMEARLSFWQIQNIWYFAKEKLDDASIGLHVGKKVTLKNLGVVGYIIVNAPSVLDSLRRLCAYNALISEGVQLRIVETENLFGVECYLFSANALVLREPVDAFFSAIISFLHEHVSTTIWAYALECSYPINEPEVYHQFFGVTVSPSQRNIIWFKRELLEQQIFGADSQLFLALQVHANALMSQRSVVPFLQNVQMHIQTALLAHDKPTLATLARNMSYSVRAVQYKLSEHGTTFSSQLDAIRKEMAMNAFTQRLSSSDVAFMLGYADISTFNKVFKRWFNCSPTEYKAMLL